MATKAIVGEKVGMTQVWDDQNRAVPVTVLKVAPVRVVQVKTPEREGYSALQVTWGFRRAADPDQARAGPLRGGRGGARAGASSSCASTTPASFEVGQQLTADLLSAGERVDAIAVSKGKGFTGAMKRHNFKGQGASHGNHKKHRVARVRSAPAPPRPGCSRAPGWPAGWAATRSPPSTSRSSRPTPSASSSW